uniref:Uncharacterized protein n=1 Tax=Oryza sativa subsp. japonica TaxID=39947 RepID=Q5Z7E1_ORYSJ|nr:hypothetical protein [Oryza sativa Japonica Group]
MAMTPLSMVQNLLQDFVDLHNTARSTEGVSEVVWDDAVVMAMATTPSLTADYPLGQLGEGRLQREPVLGTGRRLLGNDGRRHQLMGTSIPVQISGTKDQSLVPVGVTN